MSVDSSEKDRTVFKKERNGVYGTWDMKMDKVGKHQKRINPLKKWKENCQSTNRIMLL